MGDCVLAILSSYTLDVEYYYGRIK
jgi:hypothetical protein